MFRWYVINTYSGHEKKVKANLEHRLISLGQRERVRQVVIPTEQVVETKDGQKVQTEKRRLPGYVLVNMDMTPDALWLVKNTPGVTGFVGGGGRENEPVPLTQAEVDRLLNVATEVRPKVRADFTVGESVKVIAGPAVRLHRRDRRDQRRAGPAEGAGQHLRARDAGRALVRPGQEAHVAVTRGAGPPARATRGTRPAIEDVMAKKVLQVIKLQIPAGQASPAPPVGPALGGASINIMEFCKAFNAQTQSGNGTITPVEVTVYEDRSFTFITKIAPGGGAHPAGPRHRQGQRRAAQGEGGEPDARRSCGRSPRRSCPT